MNSLETLSGFEQREMEVPPWPELAEEPLPEFPTALLPEACARLVEAVAASMPVPVDYAACAMIGAANAALVGRVAVQPRPGHVEPIQLYLCLGGESGTNKSGPMRLFIDPLEEWLAMKRKDVKRRNRDRAAEREVLAKQESKRDVTARELVELRRQQEGMEDEPEPETILSDTTTEALAKRLKKQDGNGILYTDEGSFINVLAGATYAKNGSVTNLDTVLKGFDGGRVFIDRAGADEPIELASVNLSITVGMQPSIYRRMTENPDLADRGFPQRVLYFLPEPLTDVNVLDLPPMPCMNEWEKLLLRLAAAHRGERLVMPLTREAAKLYDLHRQDMQCRVQGDMGGSLAIQAWARKAHGKTARLAGLLALLENPQATLVEANHVRAAVMLMDGYFIPHMKKAFGGSSDLSPDALALLTIVRKLDTFTQGDLLHRVGSQRRYKGDKGKEHFQRMLCELSARGYIRPGTAQVGSRGRKKGPVWMVNPALHARVVMPVEEGEL